MKSINDLTIRGNLGADPETFEAKGSKGVRFRVATNRSFTRQSGEKVKETTWHPVTVWGDRAIAMAASLHKGDEVRVSGRVELRQGTDQAGVERTYYQVHAYEVEKVVDPSRAASAPPAEAAAEESYSDEPSA